MRYGATSFRSSAPTRCCTRSIPPVDAYRERLLIDGQLSRRTIQKILVLLHGIRLSALSSESAGPLHASSAEA
jgi:hypothetical protein